MAGDPSNRLPAIGETGRLHVAGRSVPVEVFDHQRDAVRLEVVEDGWSLTDGEARLVCTGADGPGIIAGSVRVLGDGRLLFTPGTLTRAVADGPGAGEDTADGQAVIKRIGRGETADIGQRRETFRVDIALEVVVLVDDREIPAHTLNLSPTGCLLRGDLRPLIDTIVVARIPVEERVLLVQARVMRVDGERFALHFRDLDAAQERALSGLIAKRQRELLRRR